MGILGGRCRGDGGTDCHSRCAHWLRNDSEFYMGCGVRAVGEIGEALPVADEASRFRGSAPIGGHDSDRKSVGTTVGNRRPLRKRNTRCNGRATARVAPTEGYKGCGRRADVGIGPYGGLQGGAMGGRPQGSPLRRVTRSACVRGRAAALHQGSFLQRSSVLWTTWATLWPRPG